MKRSTSNKARRQVKTRASSRTRIARLLVAILALSFVLPFIAAAVANAAEPQPEQPAASNSVSLESPVSFWASILKPLRETLSNFPSHVLAKTAQAYEFKRTYPQEFSEPRNILYPGLSSSRVFGTASDGTPLHAYRLRGSYETTRTVIVVGVVHGAEEEGRRVAEGLLDAEIPADLDLWVIPTINPYGEAHNSPKNANGVNLNRNFPANWEFGTHYSSGRYFGGNSPASEPETAAFMKLTALIDPDFSLYYHAPWNEIDCDVDVAGQECVRYAENVGFSVDFAARPGTMTDWAMTEGYGSAWVVEFPYDRVSQSFVDRHIAAALQVGS